MSYFIFIHLLNIFNILITGLLIQIIVGSLYIHLCLLCKVDIPCFYLDFSGELSDSNQNQNTSLTESLLKSPPVLSGSDVLYAVNKVKSAVIDSKTKGEIF